MMLYLVRHAWAGHFGDPEWPDDFQRPLSEKGAKRFSSVLEKLTAREFSPELVATSPLVRCRQTAELIAQHVEPTPELVELDELQPGSELESLVEWTAKRSEEVDSIVWVGHAPDVGRMAAALIGQAGWIRLAKGAVCAIRFYDTPELGGGELRWLVTAKILGC